MNCRRILVVIALAALVAGTAALVYAQNEAPAKRSPARPPDGHGGNERRPSP